MSNNSEEKAEERAPTAEQRPGGFLFGPLVAEVVYALVSLSSSNKEQKID